MRLLLPLLLVVCGAALVQANIFTDAINNVKLWWGKVAAEECPDLKRLVTEEPQVEENFVVSSFYYTFYACEERAESNEWIYDSFFGRLGFFVRSLAQLPFGV